MNISITFRQMEATESMKAYANEKVAKLQKFLRQPMHGQVTFSCQKTTNLVEVDLHSGGQHYHASDSAEDMYATIDTVVDKLERQIRDEHGSHKKKGADRASGHLLPDED